MRVAHATRSDSCPSHGGTGRARDSLGRDDRVGTTALSSECAAVGRGVRRGLVHREGRSGLDRGHLGPVDDSGSRDGVSNGDAGGRVVAGSGKGCVTCGGRGKSGGEERVGLGDGDDAPGDAGGAPRPEDQSATVTEASGPGDRV